MRTLVLFGCVSLAAWAQQTAGGMGQGKFTVSGGELPYLYSMEPAPPAAAPLLVVLPEAPPEGKQPGMAEWERWSGEAKARGWRLFIPLINASSDPGLQVLEAMIQGFSKAMPADPERVYAAGTGLNVPAILYAVSRMPHLFTAAALLDGSPKPAMDSDRLYAGNTQLVPVFWSVAEAARPAIEPLRQKLVAAGLNLQFQTGAGPAAAAEFLGKQRRDAFPAKIDCETGSTAFGRCYWLEVVKFDAGRRNDALRSTRVAADLRASLDLGGFGFKTETPGPGVVVEWLPDGYKGPLQLKDRIFSISGKPVHDAKHYVELMGEEKQERPAAILVERGKERMRLQTRVLMPKREEVLTARVQAEYQQQAKEIVLVSRGVVEIRLTVPQAWVPAAINWNGQAMTSAAAEGCYQMTEGQPGSVRRCGG